MARGRGHHRRRGVSAGEPRRSRSVERPLAPKASIVKHYARRAGLDPDDLAGHSLRRGWLTSAARNGPSVFKLQAVFGHRSLQTLQAYVDDAGKFDDHAGSGLLARDRGD